MKLLLSLLSVCLMAVPSSDGTAGRVEIKTHPLLITKAQTFGGIEFPSNSRFDIMESGQVYYAWPGDDLKANGIRILKDTQLMLRGNGKVQSLWTVPKQVILDTVLPAGTWVTFKADGTVDTVTFETSSRMRNLDLIQHVAFYRNGSIKNAILAQDQSIDGLPLRKGAVSFHPNGKIMHGVLAKPVEIRARQANGVDSNVSFEADVRVYIDATGMLVGAFPVGAKAQSIQYSKELHPLAEH